MTPIVDTTIELTLRHKPPLTFILKPVLTPPGVLDTVNRILTETGLKRDGAAAHGFRRSFNDTLVVNARGYDIERRLLLGHSLRGDVNAYYYTRPTIDRLAEVVERAYIDDPIL